MEQVAKTAIELRMKYDQLKKGIRQLEDELQDAHLEDSKPQTAARVVAIGALLTRAVENLADAKFLLEAVRIGYTENLIEEEIKLSLEPRGVE